LDASFVRVIEDVIDTLIVKNIINITDLPGEAQAKLFARKSFRERVVKNSLRLFSDSAYSTVIDDTNFGGLPCAAVAACKNRRAIPQAARPNNLAPLPGTRTAASGGVTMEKLTPYADVTSYNNYYEFGTDKSDPGRNAHTLKTRPWTVAIEGEVKKPRTFDID